MLRTPSPALQYGALLLFAALLLGLLTHSSPSLCNDSSRLAAAESLAHRGELTIDGSYFAYCCDQITVDGRRYSDKPPLLSVVLAGELLLLEALTGWSVPADLPRLYRGLTLLSSGMAFFAALLAVRRLVLLMGGGGWWAVAVAMGACGATLMLPFSVVLSSHSVAAALLCWLAVMVAGAARQGAGMAPRRTSIIAGALAGAAPAVDLLTAPLALGLVVWHLSPHGPERWRRLGWLAFGGALPVALHMALSAAVTGNPVAPNLDPAAFQISPELRETLSGTSWKHSSTGALASYAYHSLAGHRGLFLYSPAALLGVIALPLLWRRGAWRGLALAVGAGLAAFLLLSIGFSNDYSGYAYGVRWHAAVAPLLVAVGGGAAAALAQGDRARLLWRGGLLLLFAPGAALAAVGTQHPWTTSTMAEYSFREVSSAASPYVKRELADAGFLLARGKTVEAAHYADHLLRRTRRSPEVWRLAVTAAARLGDLDRLDRYAAMARDSGIPPRATQQLGAFIQQARRQAAEQSK